MKKIIIIAIALCLLCSLPACASKKDAGGNEDTGGEPTVDNNTVDDNTTDDGTVDNNIVDDTEVPEDNSGDEDNISDIENEKPYYGTWEVTSSVCTAPVYALAEDEIAGFIGAKLVYSEQLFSFNEEELSQPVYAESSITKDEFAEEYNNKLSLSELGISEDTALKVDVENGMSFGSFLYVKNETTIIISYNGVFFEAVKK